MPSRQNGRNAHGKAAAAVCQLYGGSPSRRVSRRGIAFAARPLEAMKSAPRRRRALTKTSSGGGSERRARSLRSIGQSAPVDERHPRFEQSKFGKLRVKPDLDPKRFTVRSVRPSFGRPRLRRTTATPNGPWRMQSSAWARGNEQHRNGSHHGSGAQTDRQTDNDLCGLRGAKSLK